MRSEGDIINADYTIILDDELPSNEELDAIHVPEMDPPDEFSFATSFEFTKEGTTSTELTGDFLEVGEDLSCIVEETEDSKRWFDEAEESKQAESKTQTTGGAAYGIGDLFACELEDDEEPVWEEDDGIPSIEDPIRLFMMQATEALPQKLLTREEEKNLGRQIHSAQEELADKLWDMPDAVSYLIRVLKNLDARKRVTATSDDSEAILSRKALDKIVNLLEQPYKELYALRRATRGEPYRQARENLREAANVFKFTGYFVSEFTGKFIRAASIMSAEKRKCLIARKKEFESSVREVGKIYDRGVAARNYMVRRNWRLSVWVAKKFRNKGISFTDLIQLGNEGLIKAADRFDPERGNKFSTYATWWVRQGITRALQYHHPVLTTPTHINKVVIQLYKMRETLEQELGQIPLDMEIADKMGISRHEYKVLSKLTRGGVSLEKPAFDGTGSRLRPLWSVLADQKATDPAEYINDKVNADQTDLLLESLPRDEAEVLRARYGIGRPQLSLQELAHEMETSRAEIRMIEARALRTLDKTFNPEKYKK